MFESVAEAERGEQMRRPLSRRIRLLAQDQLRHHDVFEGVEVRQQMVELVDEAERLAPEIRSTLVVEPRGIAAGKPDSPLEAAFEKTYRLQ